MVAKWSVARVSVAVKGWQCEVLVEVIIWPTISHSALLCGLAGMCHTVIIRTEDPSRTVVNQTERRRGEGKC